MSTTVSVAATMRASRADFSTPGIVHLHGDLLLEEAEAPASKNAKMLRAATGTATKVYGTIPGVITSRQTAEVLDSAVEVDGAVISMSTVMTALSKFYEKWRAEDLASTPKTGPAATAEMGPVPEVDPPTIVPTGVPERLAE